MVEEKIFILLVDLITGVQLGLKPLNHICDLKTGSKFVFTKEKYSCWRIRVGRKRSRFEMEHLFCLLVSYLKV